MNIIKNEKLEITLLNNKWIIQCISYEGEESPYRIIHDKNEIIILNKYDYISFHAIYNDESINIKQKDPNINISLKDNLILIYNPNIE